MAARRNRNPRHSRPQPFPKQQLCVLALCRICEPIAFMSVFPYIYFMVKDFGIAKNEQQIAIYTGMITSSFTIAEFSTSVLWGKLSDRIGRKPVLLTGLAGTAVSMMAFGFAPNLPVALVARALGGLLNGNIGVLQTTVAELVTVKEHQPRAYTIMPFVWCLGSILGPTVGGALADPVKSYPTLFADGTIWARHPYLLPNLFCTVVVVISVTIGILFLEETHSEKKFRRDVGLEAGQWIIRKLRACADATWGRPEKTHDYMESFSLLRDADEQPPGYRTTDGSPKLPSTEASEPAEHFSLNNDDFEPRKPIATHKAFTRQVVLNIVGYGVLAYHTMTFDQLLPIFLSTPNPGPDAVTSLPFQFTGGFGLNTKQVGYIMSFQGIYSIISTLFLFPFAVRRLGALRLFRLLSFTYPILYFTTPYLILLPENVRIPGVYLVAMWKCTYSTMAYPSNAILLTNSAPSMLLLGTINGVAASTASLARAFGPTVSGMLYSAGLKLGYSGLAWWCSVLITFIGSFLSLKMTDKGGRMSDEKTDEEDIDPEMGCDINQPPNPTLLDA